MQSPQSSETSPAQPRRINPLLASIGPPTIQKQQHHNHNHNHDVSSVHRHHRPMQISPFIMTTANNNNNNNNDDDAVGDADDEEEDSTAAAAAAAAIEHEQHSRSGQHRQQQQQQHSSVPHLTTTRIRTLPTPPTMETMRPYWMGGGIPAAPTALPQQHGNVWLLGTHRSSTSTSTSTSHGIDNNNNDNHRSNNSSSSNNSNNSSGSDVSDALLQLQHSNRQHLPLQTSHSAPGDPVIIKGGIRASVPGMHAHGAVQSAVVPAAVRRTRRQLAKPYDNGRKRASKACVECNKKKVRCGFDRPCRRCVRLGLECVEVVSTKKRGRKKKSKKQQEQSDAAPDGSANSVASDNTLMQPQTLVIFPRTHASATTPVTCQKQGPINPLLITDATGSSKRSTNINPLLQQ